NGQIALKLVNFGISWGFTFLTFTNTLTQLPLQKFIMSRREPVLYLWPLEYPYARSTSHVIRIDEGSNVIPIRSANNNLTGGDELTAFRGLLTAATGIGSFLGGLARRSPAASRDPKRFAPLSEELSGPR